MKLSFLFALPLLFCSLPSSAGQYQRTHAHPDDARDLVLASYWGCGLLEAFGPSRSEHEIDVRIEDSPFGPLVVRMPWEQRVRVEYDDEKLPEPPGPNTGETVRAWVLKQLPRAPKPCTRILSQVETQSTRIEYPDQRRRVKDAEYVSEHLRLAGLAAARGDHDEAASWRGSAFAMYSFDLDAAEQKAMRRSKEMRRAAYEIVETTAPPGLSDIGIQGYCRLYGFVAQLFPPRSKKERGALRAARKRLRCPR